MFARCSNVLTLMAVSFLSVSLDSSIHCLGQQQQMKQSQDALKDGNRLLAVEHLKEAIKQMSAGKNQPGGDSMLLQALPLISDYDPVQPLSQAKVSTVQNPEYVEKLRSSVSEVEQNRAIEKIVELAKDRRIVILNEAHDSPQHRAFGLLLATALRKKGFTHLAVETLSLPNGKAGPVKFDYPKIQTGHYSSAPVFGDFLRQSNLLGYKMVAYEINPNQLLADRTDVFASIMQRENIQSDNLIEQVIEKDPDSKLFVYVGYSHATENWQKLDDDRELGWLAAQLHRKTGIDPLTIDQVGGSFNPKQKNVDPVFAAIQDHFKLKRSSVFENFDLSLVTSDAYYGKVDLTVFHPPQQMIDGRPDWLRMEGYRRSYAMDNQDLFGGKPTLVQAFVDKETKHPIPVDQVLVKSPTGKSHLLLPKGIYRIETHTSAGERKKIGRVKIQ